MWKVPVSSGPETVSRPHIPMVRQPFCLKRREHRSCLLMEKVTKHLWLLIISHNPHQPLLWLLNYLKVGWIKQTNFWWQEGYKVLTEFFSFIMIQKKLYYKISISGILTKMIVNLWWKYYRIFKIALLFSFYYTCLPFINISQNTNAGRTLRHSLVKLDVSQGRKPRLEVGSALLKVTS